MAAPQLLYGDTQPQTAPVATAVAIEIGDLVAITAGTITNAAGETWDTNELTTRTAFVAKFYGASGQKKKANVASVFGNSDPNMLTCYQSGTFAYDAVSDSYLPGDLLGPAKAAGNALLSDKLKKATGVADATHVCVHASGAAATRVIARMRRVGPTL